MKDRIAQITTAHRKRKEEGEEARLGAEQARAAEAPASEIYSRFIFAAQGTLQDQDAGQAVLALGALLRGECEKDDNAKWRWETALQSQTADEPTEYLTAIIRRAIEDKPSPEAIGHTLNEARNLWPGGLLAQADALCTEIRRRRRPTIAELELKLSAFEDQLEAATASEPSAAAPGKGVTPRNAKFLEWYEGQGTDTNHKPKKIQEKWWAMTDAERAAICPDNPARVTRETVVQGIKLARKQRDDNVAKTTSKQKRPAGKA